MDKIVDQKLESNQTFWLKAPTLGKKISPIFLFTFLFFCSNSLSSGSYHPLLPLDEIKTIIVEQALRPPSIKSLSKLKMKRLNKDLHRFDPYAHYVPPASSESLNSTDLRLGVKLFSHKSGIWLSPEPGGPASKQGLPELAELKKINGKGINSNLSTTSKQLDLAIMSGQVTFSLLDDAETNDYTISPTSYYPPSVTSSTVDQYTFIRLADFISHRTAPSFLGLYQAVQQTDTSIILDLRGCPGGDLFEALEIAGMFVPAGELLLTSYDQRGKVHAFISPEGKKLRHPSYLLLDNRTASAAEILAGILRERKIGHLMGAKSYGKCDSQTVFDLSNGGKLWLTTLSTFFADNTSCSHRGVKPDRDYPDISIAKKSEIIKKIAFF